MPSDRDEREIEIIPPGRTSQRDDSEWVFIGFDDRAKAFRDLPWHKRFMLVAASIAGLIIFASVLFLIVASAVLIWIPLLLATIAITTITLFLRSKMRKR